jgi:hypothetical protein
MSYLGVVLKEQAPSAVSERLGQSDPAWTAYPPRLALQKNFRAFLEENIVPRPVSIPKR